MLASISGRGIGFTHKRSLVQNQTPAILTFENGPQKSKGIYERNNKQRTTIMFTKGGILCGKGDVKRGYVIGALFTSTITIPYKKGLGLRVKVVGVYE
jgi:hypothetical protein